MLEVDSGNRALKRPTLGQRPGWSPPPPGWAAHRSADAWFMADQGTVARSRSAARGWYPFAAGSAPDWRRWAGKASRVV